MRGYAAAALEQPDEFGDLLGGIVESGHELAVGDVCQLNGVRPFQQLMGMINSTRQHEPGDTLTGESCGLAKRTFLVLGEPETKSPRDRFGHVRTVHVQTNDRQEVPDRQGP